MKYLYIASVLLFCLGSKDRVIEDERPNVVFIMVDDLGWKDVGYMGGDFFETPNIDKLATEGMVFTNSYAGAANCAPSRACLMTGQNTPRHGIYTVSPSTRGKAKDRRLIPTKNTDSLQLEMFTMAEMFKQAGYTTGTFGKWHLGKDPTLQGFDVNVAGDLRGNPGKNGYFSPYNVANLEDGPEGEHLTDRLTSEAIKFLNTNKATPFFIYVPFYSVHTPILAKKELIEKYKSKTNNLKNINPTYAAMVETMDINVGRLLSEIKKLNLDKNTIIVFTSDNGGIRYIARQDPLRAGKGSYYEGGTRVPTIIKWHGKIKPNSNTNVPIVNMDFFPTFQEIVKVSLPNKTLDGKSILPILKGNTIKKRALFWHFPIYLENYNNKMDDSRDPLFRTRPGSTLVYDNWKLHQYFEDNGLELYHLTDDIGERNNLAESHPEKLKEMMAILTQKQREMDAPIPTMLNPEYRE
ncbi:sulfatase [Muricauda sp. SCSIO 64092]|uniref:sulfatase n=1 Tax=Allomuricauda sp. SCSIO 64092 TaxID=2908842 RepID=UPI001FF5651E|nr:sulfatase [Muricauda sp. SCSIO 64092]UOY05780.1 sulfatase [Muricauda sp. SCSIO 64092]